LHLVGFLQPRITMHGTTNICIQLDLVGFLQPRITMHGTTNIKTKKSIYDVYFGNLEFGI